MANIPNSLKLEVHNVNVHGKAQCSYCQETFETNHEMQMHFYLHHWEEIHDKEVPDSGSAAKAYVCAICQFTFRDVTKLRRA